MALLLQLTLGPQLIFVVSLLFFTFESPLTPSTSYDFRGLSGGRQQTQICETSESLVIMFFLGCCCIFFSFNVKQCQNSVKAICESNQYRTQYVMIVLSLSNDQSQLSQPFGDFFFFVYCFLSMKNLKPIVNRIFPVPSFVNKGLKSHIAQICRGYSCFFPWTVGSSQSNYQGYFFFFFS